MRGGREKPDPEALRKKGVVKQFLGVVMTALGGLNLLFAMKGGTSPDPFNYVILMAGVAVLAIGITQSREGRAGSEGESEEGREP